MADPQYPQIAANAFAQGCEGARTAVTSFFTALYTKLVLTPDERGLTDQVLYQLTRYVTLVVTRPSVAEEAVRGYDYSWQFTTRNPQSGQAQKRLLFFQAKTYKAQVYGGREVEVADFCYANNNGMQMNLLNTWITQQRNAHPGVVVTGGYLVYGRKTVQFIPIEDVLGEYHQQTTHGVTQIAAINRNMSQVFLNAGEAHYNIQNILTHMPA